MDLAARRDRLRELHREGTFVIPNPFDRGSARLLAHLGFAALATTSSGLAASRGQRDMTIVLATLLDHVADLAPATDLPLHVDAERGFADDPAGVADTVRRLAEAGASGCSIEDWDPATGAITPLAEAAARVEAAAGAASDTGMVLTARCEHHIHGIDDLDATIERLAAYRDAGAEVVYAPGPLDEAQVRRIVTEVGVPVNALLRPGGPTVAELAAAGVRRVSLGGNLARAAYGAVVEQARHVLAAGVHSPAIPLLDASDIDQAFGS